VFFGGERFGALDGHNIDGLLRKKAFESPLNFQLYKH
jgi:hypothetical protein